MRDPRSTIALTGQIVLAACVFSLLGLSACGLTKRPARPSLLLLERDSYQALYSADGRLDRIAYDANGDRRADAIVYYDPDARPIRAEIDTDRDGAVDHWERMLDGGRWLEENDHDGDGKPEVRFFRDSSGAITPVVLP